MQLNRNASGVCSGLLQDFRWEILEENSGSLSSPIGVIGSQIFCNSTVQSDGQARAIVLCKGQLPVSLGASTYLIACARDNWAAGVVGFGHSAFLLDADGKRIELDTPTGAESIDLDCVNSDGLVGGSIMVRGEECGAIWNRGQCEVIPSIRAITALNDSGDMFGTSRSGVAVRVGSEFEFGGVGRVVAANLAGDALVSSASEISVWRSFGGVEAIGIRGFERISALGWSDAGVILGFGVTKSGFVKHWLFDQKSGVRVLTGQEIDRGLILEVVSAIGKNGELAGLAFSESNRYVVRLF